MKRGVDPRGAVARTTKRRGERSGTVYPGRGSSPDLLAVTVIFYPSAAPAYPGERAFTVLCGRQMPRAEVDDSPLTDVVWAAKERDRELPPAVDMRAMPGAEVADAVIDLFRAEFRAVAGAEVEQGVGGCS